MVTKLAFIAYKPHMSRRVPPVTASTGVVGQAAAGVGLRHIPGLVFAPVRPGIVAACMVESPGSGRVPGTDRPRWIGQIRNRQKEYFADDREGIAQLPGASKLSMQGNRTGRETCPWLR